METDELGKINAAYNKLSQRKVRKDYKKRDKITKEQQMEI